jgi:hypothetical protein
MAGMGQNPPCAPAPRCLLSPGADMVRDSTGRHSGQPGNINRGNSPAVISYAVPAGSIKQNRPGGAMPPGRRNEAMDWIFTGGLPSSGGSTKFNTGPSSRDAPERLREPRLDLRARAVWRRPTKVNSTAFLGAFRGGREMADVAGVPSPPRWSPRHRIIYSAQVPVRPTGPASIGFARRTTGSGLRSLWSAPH